MNTTTSKQVQFIYALIAAVLLLQSLAIWHDAEHPFHEEQALCDTLHVISKTPLANTAGALAAVSFEPTVEYSFVFTQSFVPRQRINQGLIRAPPTLSLFSL